MSTYHFDTRVLHAGLHPEQWHGATQPPIFQNASYAFDTADSLSRCFAGQESKDVYSRLSNPTNKALEERIAALEGGKDACVTASGMAAISSLIMGLVRAGDEIVAGSSLFVSTHNIFKKLLPRYGVTTTLVDPTDLAGFETAITEKTRLLFVEIIGNPQMDVPDIRSLADLAHSRNIPLVVDNTLASPWLCRPIELGADAVVHSTTKFLNGHGNALGGVIVDSGTFDFATEKFADFEPFLKTCPTTPLLHKVWSESIVNFGPVQAPLHSYLTMLGLDTLHLRMPRHMENAAALAEFLQSRPEVAWVNYPGLSDHPCHDLAETQFAGKGFGSLMTFGLKDGSRCMEFVDNLELVSTVANLGDSKTLIIHPRSTQFVSFTDDACREIGIPGEMLRFSVGIEHAGDIRDDLARALEGTLS
jgi:O-acetylhomoserine (thiol)-lyase